MTAQPLATGSTAADRCAHNLAALEAYWQVPFKHVGREPARARLDDGALVMRDAQGEWRRVHSARDPYREAAAAIDVALEGRPLPRAVVLVGAGLGFAIDVIEDRSPGTRILVLELEPDCVPLLLGRRDFAPLVRSGRLLILSGPEFSGAAVAWRILDGEETPLVVTHAMLARERPGAAAAAQQLFKRAVHDWQANLDARRRFAGRYLANTLANLRVLSTAGDVAALAGRGAGRPAVLAAAGPSLNRNLAELAALGPSGSRGILVTVDTALRPCLRAGLQPQFVVAVDPAPLNARHLTDLPDCPATCLVAEPSIDPSVFERARGPVVLYRVGPHAPWPWLETRGITRGLLRVWGSVLTAAVDFAILLGCDPLVFIGADLAYTGRQPYCRDTVYEADWEHARSLGKTLDEIWSPWLDQANVEEIDVAGHAVPTTAPLLAFRDWLVDRSVTERAHRFVNATGGGLLQGGRVVQAALADVLCRTVEPIAIDGARVDDPAVGWHAFEALITTSAPPWNAWVDATAADSRDVLLQTVMQPLEASFVRRLESSADKATTRLPLEIPAGETDEVQLDRLTRMLREADSLPVPVVDRLRLASSLSQVVLRTRTPRASALYPALLDLFRSVLTPDVHPAYAAQVYDQLFAMRWMVAGDPAELAGFRGEAVDPLVAHARAWADSLGLPPRRTPGRAPHHVAYLSRSSRFTTGDAVARVAASIVDGHRLLASSRFRFSYYAWGGVDEPFRSHLESAGVTVRVYDDWPVAPCSTLARIRGDIAADGVDALVTDMNLGLPTVLFETRVAPVQAFLDMGFSEWGGALDYTFLGFAGDAARQGLDPAHYERIDYRMSSAFVEATVDPAARLQQRDRFRGASHVFGFVGRLVKLSPDYFRAIGGLLARVPDAAVYLGGVGDAASVRQAIDALGDVSSRVVFDAHAVDGQLMVAAVDTFLDTFPFLGGVSCIEAQAAGRPVVHLRDERAGFARFKAVNRDARLLADTVDGYVDIAARLATDPTEWRRASDDARRVAIRATDVVTTAAQLEDAFDRLLARCPRG